MIHIPFFPHDHVLTQSEKLLWERKLKVATIRASSSVGSLISLGNAIVTDSVRRFMATRALPYVTEQLEGLPYRVLKSYALLLTVARQVLIVILYIFVEALKHNNYLTAM